MLKESNNDVFYVFAARPAPWSNEGQPPPVDKSIFAYDNEIFKNIIFGKRVTDSDVAPMIKRITWTANTVYDIYDVTQITETANLQYYVVTSEKKVFKCIDNNKGIPSTIEPFLDSRRTFKTSDGYSWRYLYTISEADFAKFATTAYIPITPNTIITAFAIPGTIDHIAVTNSGSEYYAYHTGNTAAVLDNSNFVIEPTASANDGFYVNSAIYFQGDLIGATSKIINYDADTKMVSVEPPISLRVDLILANSGAGEFTSNLTARQEYFNVFLSNTVGPSLPPSLVITQRGASGANQNYTIIDTFDGGARLHRNDQSQALSLTDPWRATSGETVQTGTVTTTANSTTVSGSGGTVFTNLVPGDFIRVGPETRQIATIASASSLTTTQAWATSYASNVWIKPVFAGFFTSIEQQTASGTINSVDTSAAIIYLSSISGSFRSGESIYQSNSSGTVAAGLVIDANSSSIYVGNVTGTFTYTSNLVINGTQSGAMGIPRSNNGILSTPRLLIVNSVGSWYAANVSALTSANSEVANAKIATFTSFPGIGTPYIVSPRVVIDGDGEGAQAYSVVNTVNYSIDSIVVTNPGTNYTYANTYLEANSLYGVGGTLRSLLSPVSGTGANVQNELDSRQTGVSIQFANSSLEGQYFTTNGTFRQIGLIKNPKFRDLSLTVNNFCRYGANHTLLTANVFLTGETVWQISNGAMSTGRVVFANSTYLELDSVSNTVAFTANAANDTITGVSSLAVSNLKSITVKSFPVNTAVAQAVYQDHTEANAILISANSTLIQVTNSVGIFTNSSAVSVYNKYRTDGHVYDMTTNSYATITNVGVPRKANNFTFDKFNQIHRVVVDSITGTFELNEVVTQGETTRGYIFNTNNDIDLIIQGVSGTFVTGDSITQTTSGATATVISANSTYLRLTNKSGTFQPGLEIVAGGSGANATTNTVYNILNLYGTDSDFAQTTDPVRGVTSNAQATTVSNRSLNPDLVRNSGEVLYIQNSTAVIKSPTSQEAIKFVIQYL